MVPSSLGGDFRRPSARRAYATLLKTRSKTIALPPPKVAQINLVEVGPKLPTSVQLRSEAALVWSFRSQMWPTPGPFSPKFGQNWPTSGPIRLNVVDARLNCQSSLFPHFPNFPTIPNAQTQIRKPRMLQQQSENVPTSLPQHPPQDTRSKMPQMSNMSNMSKIAKQNMSSARTWPVLVVSWTTLGRIWPKLVEIGRKSAEVGPSLVKFGRVCARSGQIGPTPSLPSLAEFGLNRSNIGRSQSNLIDAVPDLAELGGDRPNTNPPISTRVWLIPGRVWRLSAVSAPKLVNVGPTSTALSALLRSPLARTPATLCEIHRFLTAFGPRSENLRCHPAGTRATGQPATPNPN